MIKNNKWKLIISSAITLLPILFGIIFWNKLPDSMATHWGANGIANGFSNKAFAVFGLPLILLAIFWLCTIITAYDPKNQDQNKKAFNMVIWIIPILSLIVNSVVYITAFNYAINIKIIISVLLGLMFIFIGNYLPKCIQNYTIGVKIKWTLQNEENWNATHRFTGKVWLICGILMLLGCFLPEKILYIFLPLLIIPVAVLPFLYSYSYYKKQLKSGIAIEEKTPVPPFWKKSSAIAFVLIAIILLIIGIISFTGNLKLDYNSQSFTIEASYYNDLTVDFDMIDSIEYHESCEVGAKTNGFNSARLLIGSFNNKEFGNYTRYSYTGSKTCVIVTSGEKVLVISGIDDNQTKDIYNELMQRWKNK